MQYFDEFYFWNYKKIKNVFKSLTSDDENDRPIRSAPSTQPHQQPGRGVSPSDASDW